MSSLAQDIGKVLENEGAGTVGVDIFDRDLDWGIDSNGILIEEVGSPESSMENPMQVQNLQITVRNSNSDDAHSKILEIRDILHGKAGYDTESYHVFQTHNISGIEDLKSDLQSRQLYRSVFRLMFEDINA